MADTGWPQDKVYRYAEPVLGEREYIAGQARGAEVRRQGEPVTLEQSAIAALGLTSDVGIEWDSRKRGDGKWQVTGRYGHQEPNWIYEPTGRTVHPLDDTARAWMGAHSISDPIEDALGMIAETPVVRADADIETIHESSTDNERPHLVALPSLEEEFDEVDVIDAGSEADFSDADIVMDTSTDTVIIGRGETPETLFEDTAPETPSAPPAPPARKAKSRKGRASVPSWDEILFGATKSDD